MEVFPTLSVAPTKVAQIFEDSTIRSQFETGFEVTRTQFTRDRSTFDVSYDVLQRVDKDLLISFLKTVRGATEFTWKNHDEVIPLSDPEDYKEYTVRFSTFPSIPAVGGRYGLYDISFSVKEV